MVIYYRWYRTFALITSVIVTVLIIVLLFQLQLQKHTDTLPLFSWHSVLNEQHLERSNNKMINNDQKLENTTTSLMCVVIMKVYEGRLGNLLFKLASAYGIAATHSCLLYLDISILNNLIPIFDIQLSNLIDEDTLNRIIVNRAVIVRHSDCQFFNDIMAPGAISYLELADYWQSYSYFLNHLDELRYQFTFNDNVVRSISPFLKRYILDEDDTIDITRTGFHNLKRHLSAQSTVRWIGIHIRRGDYLSNQSMVFGHTVSSEDYVHRAMDYFNRRYANRTIFFVSSDDKTYCKRLFREKTNVYVTPKYYSPVEDLAILSLCHDTIVTGGTFGWWAGLLAGGTVIHDINYPKKGSRLEALCPRKAYFPPWFLFM